MQAMNHTILFTLALIFEKHLETILGVKKPCIPKATLYLQKLHDSTHPFYVAKWKSDLSVLLEAVT